MWKWDWPTFLQLAGVLYTYIGVYVGRKQQECEEGTEAALTQSFYFQKQIATAEGVQEKNVLWSLIYQENGALGLSLIILFTHGLWKDLKLLPLHWLLPFAHPPGWGGQCSALPLPASEMLPLTLTPTDPDLNHSLWLKLRCHFLKSSLITLARTDLSFEVCIGWW